MSENFGQFLDRIGKIPVLTQRQEVELAQRIQPGQLVKQRIDDAAAIRQYQRENPGSSLETSAEALKLDSARVEQSQAPLTPEDESALADRNAAVTELVHHNIRLAVHQARRYSSRDIPLEDLVHEAIIGVHRAAEKFEWERGLKFSTYATWWIRHMIQRTVYRDRATIRVPGHIIARQRAIHKFLTENPEANLADAAEKLEITLQQAEDALSGARVVGSLDAPYPGDEGGDRYGAIPDENSPDPTEIAEEAHPKLHEALGNLTELERRVVELRWGFDGPVLSRDDVAEVLGVRPHVVQRNQRSALAKLKEQLKPDELEV